ncbi:FG-GAP-like repeat-containing protein [Novipirellula sp. SH528]|uniref:FG-GAP-like repeat-containing protein n=1 Tax=Novipirellula sp. SH528 TaxID=3454466 RepID=UPI003F9FAF8F
MASIYFRMRSVGLVTGNLDSCAPWRRAGLLLVLLMAAANAGCGDRDAGVSPEELLRRRQLKQSVASSKTKTIDERLAATQKFLEERNQVAAQAELRPLMISHRDHPQVLLLAAKCEAAAGHKLAAANLADEIDENDVEVYREAAWMSSGWLADLQQYDRAIQRLEVLLLIDPQASRVHRRIVILLNKQGRQYEAAAHRKALLRMGEVSEIDLYAIANQSRLVVDASQGEAASDVNWANDPLAEAKLTYADRDVQTAVVSMERLVEMMPESTAVAAFAARVYSESLEDKRLVNLLERVPSGIEREPEYWYAVGMWMQRQGRHREAVRCLGEAIARDETNQNALSALSRSLTLLGETEAAKCTSERYQHLSETLRIASAIAARPGTQRELLRMSELLDALGRIDEAIAWRIVSGKRYGASDSQLQVLSAKLASLATDPHSDVEAFKLACGIDLDDWPLPSLKELANTQTSSIGPESVSGQTENGAKIQLVDVAPKAKLNFQYDNGDDPSDDSNLLHQMTGGGIGVIDFDLDGWPDLYMTQGGGEAFDAMGSKPNSLFRNQDGKQFEECGEESQTGDAGYGQGVAVADINQDGFPDLLVANIGRNVFFRNNGDGTFARSELPHSNPQGDWTSSIACGDLSGDHLPEIVEVNYVDDPSAMEIYCSPMRDICNPSVFKPALDRVWQVDADGKMSSWSGCKDMDSKPNYGFAAVVANLDAVPGNELFIANDTGMNHFWVQPRSAEGEPKHISTAEDVQLGETPQANRTLVELASVFGCAAGMQGERQGCMGIASGDFDRNGRLDLHVTNFWNQASDLYLQQSSGLFVNASSSHGLYAETRMTVAWGTQAIDFDRDGWLDLAVLNGHLADHRHRGEPYQMKPQLFRGKQDGFQLVEHAFNRNDFWSKPTLGRTMAIVDWNRDMKPDLVANHLDAPVALLENQTIANSSIQFELQGTTSERDAIGAVIYIQCGQQRWTSWVVGGDGFLCSNEAVVDFGVGNASQVDTVQVEWPSGETQSFSGLKVDHRYLIVEGESDAFQR